MVITNNKLLKAKTHHSPKMLDQIHSSLAHMKISTPNLSSRRKLMRTVKALVGSHCTWGNRLLLLLVMIAHGRYGT